MINKNNNNNNNRGKTKLKMCQWDHYKATMYDVLPCFLTVMDCATVANNAFLCEVGTEDEHKL